MATIPPTAHIRAKLSEWIAGLSRPEERPPDLTLEERSVAEWIRGNEKYVETLARLLASRIENRGRLPIPSNSRDSDIRVACDSEIRAIIEEIYWLYASPVNSGSKE